jgi:hypothetical protein
VRGEFIERHAAHEVHHEEGPRSVEAPLVDADDVRMLDPRDRLELALEAAARGRRHLLRLVELHRALDAARLVADAHDVAERAASQRTENPPPPADDPRHRRGDYRARAGGR